jgi:hypothetical protein
LFPRAIAETKAVATEERSERSVKGSKEQDKTRCSSLPLTLPDYPNFRLDICMIGKSPESLRECSGREMRVGETFFLIGEKSIEELAGSVLGDDGACERDHISARHKQSILTIKFLAKSRRKRRATKCLRFSMSRLNFHFL